MNVVEAERTHTEELEGLERVPRPEKVAEVERLTEIIREARAIYLTDFRGINVERMNQLRGKFRAEGVQYRIVKNKLLKLAANEAGLAEWVADLEGPTALAVGTDDAIAPAKVIKSFQDEHKREADYLGFKGGLLAGEPIDEAMFVRLASLPGRDELIAKLLYLLTYPMRGLVTVLSAVPRGLVYALEDYRKQRIEGGEVPEALPGSGEAEEAEVEGEETGAEAGATSEVADDAAADDAAEEKAAEAAADGSESAAAEAEASDVAEDETAVADGDEKAAEAAADGGEADSSEAGAEEN